jgi:hypothetical protein
VKIQRIERQQIFCLVEPDLIERRWSMLADGANRMTYRTQTPAVHRCTIQTAPTSSALALLGAGALFLGPPGGVLLIMRGKQSVATVGFLGIFVVVGAWLLVLGYRSLRTRHRFTLTDEELVIEWVRGDTIDKTERIPRGDLIDVAVDDEPASGGQVFGLVLGTRNGEIDLCDGRTSWGLSFYQDRCDQLAAFLGVPVRPR